MAGCVGGVSVRLASRHISGCDMRWILCAKQLLLLLRLPRQGGSITGLQLQTAFPPHPTPPTPPCPPHSCAHPGTDTETDRHASCMILSRSLPLPKPQFLRIFQGSEQHAHMDIQYQPYGGASLSHRSLALGHGDMGTYTFLHTHSGTHICPHCLTQNALLFAHSIPTQPCW